MPLIITDSTCDLSLAQAEALGVEMLSLRVNFGSEEFSDKRTITNEEFYAKMAASTELPTTTLVSVGEFSDAFARHPHESIVVVLLSHKLSGTYQSAVVAKALSGRDDIYLVDSLNVTLGLGMLVTYAAALRDAGKTAEQIADELLQKRASLRIYAVIDTLKYLVKGGRLSAAQGAVGSVLGVKPIIEIADGEVRSVSKARGMKAGVREIARMTEQGAHIDRTMPHCLAHTGSLETVAQLRAELDLNDAESYLIGSVVGAHAGPGAAAVVYFEKQ